MALLAGETKITRIGEGSDQMIVAEKNEVVAVEVEPGVFSYQTRKQRAVITAQEEVPRIQTRELRPALPAPTYVTVKRGCCAECFHCDEDEWYKCTGKGPGWIPFYILFYLILGTIGLVFLILICVCWCFCPSNNDND